MMGTIRGGWGPRSGRTGDGDRVTATDGTQGIQSRWRMRGHEGRDEKKNNRRATSQKTVHSIVGHIFFFYRIFYSRKVVQYMSMYCRTVGCIQIQCLELFFHYFVNQVPPTHNTHILYCRAIFPLLTAGLLPMTYAANNRLSVHNWGMNCSNSSSMFCVCCDALPTQLTIYNWTLSKHQTYTRDHLQHDTE